VDAPGQTHCGSNAPSALTLTSSLVISKVAAFAFSFSSVTFLLFLHRPLPLMINQQFSQMQMDF
jgi:hypothetical protein